ncbi:carotenoid biosynthesis protein [Mucilaginibacter sp. HMF5004]|uniref:carotenoid biosynthesis protein n=1 Tax=Mucilaginibacter rivuli TaxID=2857527 RepID=UPI001C5D79F9|nr:carotenoid biosynthesis protein [Mucilaginibacter rivuli]MBW4891267.1 carotenoid biosynthesis protein [Mucilaginibacter rivuli]
MKPTKEVVSIAIVVLFHLVGIVGFYTPALKPFFLILVPWFILLMAVVICYSHDKPDIKFAAFAILIILLGYGIEWRGVNKHTFFGNYGYGEPLGIKFDDVPIIIGFNWLLITYSVGVSMRYLIKSFFPLRILGGAVLMVFLDMAIEPVATRLDYWHWHIYNSQLNAPTSNYIDWFFVSLAFLTIFELFQFKKQNRLGLVLLGAQFAFFILLRWAVHDI